MRDRYRPNPLLNTQHKTLATRIVQIYNRDNSFIKPN